MASLTIKRAIAAFIDFWLIISLIYFINWAHSYLDSLALQMTKSPVIDSPINYESLKRSKEADFYIILVLVPFIYYAATFFSPKCASLGQWLMGLRTNVYGKAHETLKICARAFLHGLLICPVVILGYAFLISLPQSASPFVEMQASTSVTVLLLALHIPLRGVTATDKITNTRITEV